MRVRDVMTTPARAVSPDDTLHKAAREMWDHGCGALAVLGATGRVVGMLTDRDVCLAAMIQEDTLERLSVASAMSPVVQSCRAEDDLALAEQTMRTHHVRRLPVLGEDGALVGMLSIDDLAVAAALHGDRAEAGLTPADIALTLAAVAAPRAHASGALVEAPG